jgi:hypothetical protein
MVGRVARPDHQPQQTQPKDSVKAGQTGGLTTPVAHTSLEAFATTEHTSVVDLGSISAGEWPRQPRTTALDREEPDLRRASLTLD